MLYLLLTLHAMFFARQQGSTLVALASVVCNLLGNDSAMQPKAQMAYGYKMHWYKWIDRYRIFDFVLIVINIICVLAFLFVDEVQRHGPELSMYACMF